MIKGFIGPNYNSDEDDVITTKQILEKLGYYKKPDYGITSYADKDLFLAISVFQKDQGIKSNGIIKNNDETAKKLQEFSQKISARSPMFRCKECGTPNGGSHGVYCKECYFKLL